jgi:hypothetical protein
MRQMISGVVAALAVMTAAAAPAYACGFGSCAPCGTSYVSPCAEAYVPSAVGAGCYGCGAGFDRLAEPTTQYYPTTGYYPTRQYYYVNQGPTYSGPGMFAPQPAYEEDAVPAWGAYEHHPYHYGYHRHRHYHHGYHYGYAPHRYHHYGYGPRYGYMHHHYGYPVLRRYY